MANQTQPPSGNGRLPWRGLVEEYFNVPSIVRISFFLNVDSVRRMELWPTSDFLARPATSFNTPSRLHRISFAYFDSRSQVEDTLERIPELSYLRQGAPHNVQLVVCRRLTTSALPHGSYFVKCRHTQAVQSVVGVCMIPGCSGSFYLRVPCSPRPTAW
jgi:hypothetical protein